MIRLSAISAAVLLGLSLPAAASQLVDALSSATGINAAATLLTGTISAGRTSGSFAQNAEAWTAEVYASAGSCLRLQINTQGADLAMGVASPSPMNYYYDDDSAGSFRPVVKIDPAPYSGWYSVNIAHYAGQPVYSDFSCSSGGTTAGTRTFPAPHHGWDLRDPRPKRRQPSTVTFPSNHHNVSGGALLAPPGWRIQVVPGADSSFTMGMPRRARPPSLPIASIRVGKRVRREFGDLESLAAGIRDLGLLHPIVVIPGNRLMPVSAD
jgi:hypothetical protein